MVDADGTDPGDAVHSLGVTDIMELGRDRRLVGNPDRLVAGGRADVGLPGHRRGETVRRLPLSPVVRRPRFFPTARGRPDRGWGYSRPGKPLRDKWPSATATAESCE